MVTISEIEAVVDKVRYMPWKSDDSPSKDPTVYAEEVGEEVRKLVEQAAKEGIQTVAYAVCPNCHVIHKIGDILRNGCTISFENLPQITESV